MKPKERVKVSFHFWATDPELLDQSIVAFIKELRGVCTLHGPVIMPTNVDKYHVMQGKAKETFTYITHERRIDTYDHVTSFKPGSRTNKKFFQTVENWFPPKGCEVLMRLF